MNLKDLPECVTTKVAHPDMSPRYVHISSLDVLREMEKLGFKLAKVTADKPRERDPRFVRHRMTFDLEGRALHGPNSPRVEFVNSHNGRTRASAAMGVFRQICSNGLVVGTVDFSTGDRHAGQSAKELVARIAAGAKDYVRKLDGKIAALSAKKLTDEQQLKFARAASELRFLDAAGQYDAELLLVPRRLEDRGNDLWRVMNRVQENAVRGGLIGRTADGRQVQSRPLTGITQDMRFNVQLWALAEKALAA